nr:MAG TPA: Site-specific DNA methylase [Caudoviricetes sp.]
MYYQGGKTRIAKHIAPIVNEAVKKSNGVLVEPFCGGCNLTTHFKGKIIANDLNKNLIALFKEAVSGRKFPDFVSREMYEEARNGNFDDALTAYIGLCASYRGKYFAGYAGTNRPTTRGRIINDQRAAINSFLRTVDGLRSLEDLEFSSLSYYDLEIKENSVVYCDPPYFGTTGYRTGGFDHERFWRWAEAVSEHSMVFVSEYTTLSDFFVPVWEMDVRVPLSLKEKRATEKLFVNILN